MNYLPEKLDNKTHPIFFALTEIQKPRTRFQLEKFVVGQHDTPEQQYKQTLVEIQNLYYTLKVLSLRVKKEEIEINRLRSTGDEMDELDAQIKEVSLEQTRLAALGAQREIMDLVDIWESFEKKFTYEEMEQLQPNYWDKRLRRQAVLEAVGGSQAQASHLDSLRQIGAIEVNDEGIKENDSYQLEFQKAKEIE